MISIITINYNNKIGLIATLESVQKQVNKNWEIIVIDGGSSDGSKEVLSNFADTLNYFVSEKDGGIYDAMNKGIREAKGSFLLFLNSGDVLSSPESLSQAFLYISESINVVYKFRFLVEGFGITWVSDENFMVNCHQAILFPNDKKFFYSTDDGPYADSNYIRENINLYGSKNIPVVLSKFYLGGISNCYSASNYISHYRFFSPSQKISELLKVFLSIVLGGKLLRVLIYKAKKFNRLS